jgi:amino-acid N-acetyltransferase
MSWKKAVDLTIRKATLQDCVAMRNLINTYADAGLMLHKNVNQLAAILQQYAVAIVENMLVGTCGYKIWPLEGIELISSAVLPEYHGRGIGKMLNLFCINEARNMGFKNFFVLTLQPGFYAKLGFREIPMESLSSKVYSDCVYCKKNHTDTPGSLECDEIAMGLIIE